MKISNKTRGTVSVFLVIILVPCILVSSIFVDLGRVHLSKNVANSSADLALNALLTNYDYDLNEWYGLTASCQDIDTHYATTAEYFTRMLKSQDLEDSEVVLFTDYVQDAFSDDEIHDLLKMEVLTSENTMVKAVDKGNLTNSTIVKTQVVEFMKYRAPITLVSGLVKTLTDGGGSDLVEQGKNEEVSKKKTEYYEAEGKLLENAYKTYTALRKYTDKTINGKEVTNDTLKSELEKLKGYRELYREMNKLYVMNFSNTSGLEMFERPKMEMPSYGPEDDEIHSGEEEVKDPNTGEVVIDAATGMPETIYVVDSDRVEDAIDDLEDATEKFEEIKQKVIDKGGAIEWDGSYPIQYWVRVDKEINSFIQEMKKENGVGAKFLDAFAQAEAVLSCEAAEGEDPDFEGLEEVITQIETNLLIYIDKDTINEADASVINDPNDPYLVLVSRLEQISRNNINEIDPDVKTLSNGKTINATVAKIAGELQKTIEDLDYCIERLTVVINGGDGFIFKDVPKLDDLADKVEKYEGALNDWESAAEDWGEGEENKTDMKVDDLKLINREDPNNPDNVSESCEKITKEAVRELKTRLEGIKEQLEHVKKAVESLKYGDKKLGEIKSYRKNNLFSSDGFVERANKKVKVADIPLKTTELEEYANTKFNELFSAYPDSNSDWSNYLLGGDEHNVHLYPGDVVNKKIKAGTDKEKVPELYKYLHEQYSSVNDEKVKDEKSKQDTAKDAGKNQADKALEDRVKNVSSNNITGKFSLIDGDVRKFNPLEALFSGIIELVGGLMSDGMTEVRQLRDDLYTGTYIMEMFSYATFENEGKRELALNKAENDGTELKLTLGNYPEKYKAVAGDPSAENKEDTWLSEDPSDTYNKSLTNHLINADNNYAYQCEVEYILYGGTNEENIKSAYENIYAIRYVLNLVSAFQNFWSTGNPTGNAVNLIANTVASITYGIIPAPVTKVIILPILTIFETSRDLERLEAGFKVEIYKSKDDWQISLPADLDDMGSLISNLSGTGGKDADKGLQYSDYITLFVHLGLKSNNTSEAMYLRTAEVIEANMKHMTKDNNYSFENAKVYFQLDAQIRTKPMIITLPIFNGYDNDLDTKTDWCTFNISTMRGY